jgi:hypothetical protein
MARELAAGQVNNLSVTPAAQRLREQFLNLIDNAQTVMAKSKP